jgi:hypothetical protein
MPEVHGSLQPATDSLASIHVLASNYRIVIDIGRDENGKRKQLTRTFDTQREARDELSRVRHQTNSATTSGHLRRRSTRTLTAI